MIIFTTNVNTKWLHSDNFCTMVDKTEHKGNFIFTMKFAFLSWLDNPVFAGL